MEIQEQTLTSHGYKSHGVDMAFYEDESVVAAFGQSADITGLCVLHGTDYQNPEMVPEDFVEQVFKTFPKDAKIEIITNCGVSIHPETLKAKMPNIKITKVLI
jgi:hypothetical protein